jgi:hypothetical protein
MADVFDELVEHRRRQSVGPADVTATQKDIAQCEEQFGVRLPQDLCEYVTRVNGTYKGEQLEFGNDLTSFFPLSAIVPEVQWHQRYNGPDLFVIADYLISSHWWCVRLTHQPSEHSRIFVRGGKKLKFVASSLDEFLRAYMSDSMASYP